MREWLNAALLTSSLILASTPLGANDLLGGASVIDGDTIEIHDERIRILNIDAPESRQTCTKPDGSEWRCGQQAALALADWIGQRTVTCASDSRDKYGRLLARCVVAGEDVATWLAGNGWAVPYRDCKCEVVRDAAGRAKAAGVGIWSGAFVMPWDFRHGQQAMGASETAPAAGCAIKGNISSSGERIYHVPGGSYYDATKIDLSKGERWFCSEAEAQAAGWRKSKR
jgi:endonuclease YncB( thermonuclease family)